MEAPDQQHRARGCHAGFGFITRKRQFAGWTVRFQFNGTAGQSFGAFATAGIELTIEGDTNDYLGKGLCGARIIVKAPEDAGWSNKDNLLTGNVALFGATDGELYLAGRAGERFCVRNSGALAVCEGVGDHGCEYMTGGTAVILGPVGRNFASGMSGGIAYVLDDGNLERMVNRKLVALYPLDALDLVMLHKHLTNHVKYTGSKIATRFSTSGRRRTQSSLKSAARLPRDAGCDGCCRARRTGRRRNAGARVPAQDGQGTASRQRGAARQAGTTDLTRRNGSGYG